MITVLLVEDEPEVLELTRLFLEMNPELSVDTCLSVKEALRKLDHKIYNVIVSDYVIPEITGIQLLKTLKFQGIDTPLIIFTGKGGEEVAIEDFELRSGLLPAKERYSPFPVCKTEKNDL